MPQPTSKNTSLNNNNHRHYHRQVKSFNQTGKSRVRGKASRGRKENQQTQPKKGVWSARKLARAKLMVGANLHVLFNQEAVY